MFSGKSKLVNRYLKSSKNWLHFCPFLLVKELSKNSTMRSILQPPVSVIEYVFFQVKFCKGFLTYKYSRVHFFAGLKKLLSSNYFSSSRFLLQVEVARKNIGNLVPKRYLKYGPVLPYCTQGWERSCFFVSWQIF